MTCFTKRLGFVAVLVLLLTTVLMTVAGPAAATTTLCTSQSIYGTELYPGDFYVDEATWTVHFWDWVSYTKCVMATGPEGWRFQGTYGVVCLAGLIPIKGDNYHWGDLAIVSRDPLGVEYDPTKSLAENLAGYGLLWTGTWDGHTLNKRTHKAVYELAGWPASVNKKCMASFNIMCGGFEQANVHSANFVATPWIATGYVTTP